MQKRVATAILPVYVLLVISYPSIAIRFFRNCIQVRLQNTVFRTMVSTYGNESRAQRKPMTELVYEGVYPTRLAERTLLSLTLTAPPRTTRKSPLSGP
jgi:hypothetical protein